MRKIIAGLLLGFCLQAASQIKYFDIHQPNGYNPNETSVVINPENTNEIVAASNINNIYFTFDGGLKWSQIAATSKHGIYGDPVLHFSGNDLYYAHLSQTPNKGYIEWFDRMVVQKINQLNGWDEISFGVGYNDDKMQDKPWLSSDNTGSSFDGNIYLTWTEFDNYESDDPQDRSRIRFSKLVPGDTAFSKAITISDTTGDCLDGDNTLEGATTAVGPNGEIYAVWSGLDRLWFDKSIDGGKTWTKDLVIAKHVEGWNMDAPNIFRANGMPFIATNPKKNQIFIVWADEFLGNGDIWLIESLDGGNTFSERIKLNTDPGEAHQYFPNIDYNLETETLAVVFYDQRHSMSDNFYDIYLAEYKVGEGVTNTLISQKPIPLPGNAFFYGDYIDISSVGKKTAMVYPVYQNTSSDIQLAVKMGNANHVEDKDQISVGLQMNDRNIALNLFTSQKCIIKLKVKYGDDNGFETKKVKFEHDTDLLDYEGSLAAFAVSDLSNTVFLKYKIKNLDTGKKTKFKTVKYILPKQV